MGKVGRAFEEVAVICQYKIAAEEPLFDVLIEDVINDTKEEEDCGMDDMIDKEVEGE